MGPRYRSVTQDHAVSDVLDDLPNDSRIHDVYEDLEWTLCRKPDVGEPIDGFWVYVNETGYGIPSIRVVYTFDDDEVRIHAIEIL